MLAIKSPNHHHHETVCLIFAKIWLLIFLVDRKKALFYCQKWKMLHILIGCVYRFLSFGFPLEKIIFYSIISQIKIYWQSITMRVSLTLCFFFLCQITYMPIAWSSWNWFAYFKSIVWIFKLSPELNRSYSRYSRNQKSTETVD